MCGMRGLECLLEAMAGVRRAGGGAMCVVEVRSARGRWVWVVCVDVKCVHVLCHLQVLSEMQECAVCVQVRAPGGLGAGSFERERRDKRENVRGVRREALRGGAGGVGEREDDETRHLHF